MYFNYPLQLFRRRSWVDDGDLKVKLCLAAPSPGSMKVEKT